MGSRVCLRSSARFISETDELIPNNSVLVVGEISFLHVCVRYKQLG
jgi:hypothetical protein